VTGEARSATPLALGYIRVSTESQAENGVSLEAQAVKIRAQARASGLRLTEVITDRGISGKSLSRPGVRRLTSEVKAGRVSAVIVWKLDRLTRSVRDLLDLLDLLHKHHARLVSITESLDTQSAVGRMVMTILGAVAQMEREQTVERVRAAAQHLRDLGRVFGTTPFGFLRRGKKLIRNLKECEVCRVAVTLRTQGRTYQQIANALNQHRKFRARGGVSWRHQHVHRMLKQWAPKLGIKIPQQCTSVPATAVKGYRTDGPAHSKARMKVPEWRRKEIARLGGTKTSNKAGIRPPTGAKR